VIAVDDAAEAIRFIARHAQPGDTCLLLGAGDVGLLAGPVIDFFHVLGHENVPQEIYAGVVG
jgi:UDP-N-acetylmuramate-alanine ligase